MDNFDKIISKTCSFLNNTIACNYFLSIHEIMMKLIQNPKQDIKDYMDYFSKHKYVALDQLYKNFKDIVPKSSEQRRIKKVEEAKLIANYIVEFWENTLDNEKAKYLLTYISNIKKQYGWPNVILVKLLINKLHEKKYLSDKDIKNLPYINYEKSSEFLKSVINVVQIKNYLNTPKGRRESEIEQLKTEKEQLKREKERLESERERLKSEKEQLDSEIEQLKSEKEQLESEREQLKSEKERLESERERLKSEKEQLDSEIEQLKRKRGQLDSTSGQIEISTYSLLERRFEQYKEEEKNRLADFIRKIISADILDDFEMVKEILMKLKEETGQLPLEIDEAYKVIRKYMNFIDNLGIFKIVTEEYLTINMEQAILAKKYTGTPFKSGHELKQVKVTSPGWTYIYENIIIAGPKYEEQEKE